MTGNVPGSSCILHKMFMVTALCQKIDESLGLWVMSQRARCKKDTKKWNQLNEIGFCWSAQEARWQEMFQELCSFVAYQNEHGNCLVPCKYRKLGVWVRDQRKHCKKRGSGTGERTWVLLGPNPPSARRIDNIA